MKTIRVTSRLPARAESWPRRHSRWVVDGGMRRTAPERLREGSAASSSGESQRGRSRCGSLCTKRFLLLSTELPYPNPYPCSGSSLHPFDTTRLDVPAPSSPPPSTYSAVIPAQTQALRHSIPAQRLEPSPNPNCSTRA
jgi:hypothetical protein